MTKSELARKLADTNPRLTYRDAEIIVGTVFREIAAALTRGGRVELRGFGAFSVKRRGGREGRNPRTGVSVIVPERHFPAFRPGEPMHHRLNAKVGRT
jgi:integration host factor subunit beta